MKMLYQQEIVELARLEQNELVCRQTGAAQTCLADVLRDQGRYREAKEAYQAGLEIKEERNDTRGMAVSKGQLGTLALVQGELADAAERYTEALTLFHRLDEPESEAVIWYQLGMVHQDAEHWEAAEQAYREAARLNEKHGLMAGGNGVGGCYDQLAQVSMFTGRVEEAELWYNKALAAYRAADDRPGMATTLNNLAHLLTNDRTRLNEARGLAEESLAIKETLDPAAMQIWNTYDILADIAIKQGENGQAAAYRAKSRQAYFAFPGWRQGIRQYEKLIAAVVQDDEVEAALAPYGEMRSSLEAAIHRILGGERDEAALCEPLDYKYAAIIRAILEGIAEQG